MLESKGLQKGFWALGLGLVGSRVYGFTASSKSVAGCHGYIQPKPDVIL